MGLYPDKGDHLFDELSVFPHGLLLGVGVYSAVDCHVEQLLELALD